MDLLDAAEVAGLVAALQADAHLQALFVGQLVGLHEHAEAGGVGAAGLFHEDVLAGLDRRLVVRGAEARRRGQDHHVDAAVDGLLVGVQADEHAVLRNVRLFRKVLFEMAASTLGPVLEGVGEGHDFDVVGHA